MAGNTPPPMPPSAPRPYGQPTQAAPTSGHTPGPQGQYAATAAPGPDQQGWQQHQAQTHQQYGYQQPAQQYAQAAPQGGRAGFGNMLVSEWTKIRTVRSTIWTLIVMVLLITGLSMVVTPTVNPDPDDSIMSISLIGMVIAQIAAATLGVLTISAEYTTGMVRTTLTAFPRRLTVLVAKAVVFGVLIFVVSLVSSYVAWLVGDAALSDKGADPVDGELMRGILGGSLYMAVIGLLGLGVGTMLRHSAGAITTLLGLILLPVIIGPMFPASVGHRVMAYSPMYACLKLIGGSDDMYGSLGPWGSLWLVAGYALVALLGGALLLRSRDV